MKSLRLDEVDTVQVAGVNWKPLRRALGATAFGVAAFTAEAGEQIIEPHDESGGGSGGHQEMYVVLSGRARFTVAGEELDAPQGTVVLVEPGEHREAVSEEPNTAVLAVGGVPGAAMPPSAFEYWFAAEPAYRAGDYSRAYEIASEGLADYPDHPSLNYQLACYLALGGRGDDAIKHLNKALAADEERVRQWGAEDADLDSLRDRPDWPL